MIDYKASAEIAGLLGQSAGYVQMLCGKLADEPNQESGLANLYNDLIIDELSRTQSLVIKLTSFVVSDEIHEDEGESAFFAGELNQVKKKEIETPVEAAQEDEEVKHG